MWNSIRERIFPLIIALSALSVSASAAFYSITGLSLLFAGASFAVIIMASSLEFAKLVIASLLYQYWEKINKILRTYLTIATFILILITSAGIYGFLSAAYQATANKAGIVENQIKLLETKKTSFEKIKGQYEVEKTSLTGNITSLRNALGSNTQSYVDNNGNVISYSSSANRKAFEKQLEVAIQKDEQLTTKIQTYNDSIINLETRIVETQNNSEVAAELGPLKYLANLTGVEMDRIINWFLLVIIFVFDPLAISLVVAANFAFAQLKKKDDVLYPVPQDKPEDSDIKHNFENDEELEEASLVDLQKWEEEEKPIPVFVDPKTGKLYYEEPNSIDSLPDEVIDEILEGEEFNLDLDGDGVVEEEEIKQVFEQADTNNDGIIDKEEAKIAKLDDTAQKLNEANKILKNIDNTIYYPHKVKEEVSKLKSLISSYFTKKEDDDDTITIF
jgi:anti-sigma-K factor RskA